MSPVPKPSFSEHAPLDWFVVLGAGLERIRGARAFVLAMLAACSSSDASVPDDRCPRASRRFSDGVRRSRTSSATSTVRAPPTKSALRSTPISRATTARSSADARSRSPRHVARRPRPRSRTPARADAQMPTRTAARRPSACSWKRRASKVSARCGERYSAAIDHVSVSLATVVASTQRRPRIAPAGFGSFVALRVARSQTIAFSPESAPRSFVFL